jgi:23S rRNA-/tRNA-specific pseudouridylate synthase/SAM-dependent methyltransferase
MGRHEGTGARRHAGEAKGKVPRPTGALRARPTGSKGQRRDGPKREWLARGVRIVHEDQDVLVVDKPSGLLTANMPGETRDALFDMVKEYAKAKNRRAKAWIIHRLDKEASGLLVFAKTEKAYNWLKEDFRAKRVHRLYMAVVQGEVGTSETATQPDSQTGEDSANGRVSAATRQLPQGTIQSFLREGDQKVTSVGLGEVAKEAARYTARPWRGERPPPGRGPRERAAQYEPEEGDPQAPRLAVTHWRVVAKGQGRTLVQLRLETGRKNQIRVHMQEFGHPIVGDRRYGGSEDPTGRVCLHATELGFTHPGTGQTVRYSSPAPASFYKLIGEKPPPASEAREQAEQSGGPSAKAGKGAAETSWESVADWYDTMIEEERSDHFREVIVPGTLRLLQPREGMRVLDLACGQGALARRLAEQRLDVVGVDAAPGLIESAKARSEGLAVRYEVGDARQIRERRQDLGEFDAVTCIMALMNIDPLEGVFRGCAELLKPGGALVGVILHPAFRSPGQTFWGWDHEDPKGGKRDGEGGTGRVKQFRRVDGYLSPGQTPITMNPGHAAHGAEPVTTWTFHRPLQTYVKALADAGFVIQTLEEWPSLRQSQPGPRAAEENRARREIPMFLGFRAIRQG